MLPKTYKKLVGTEPSLDFRKVASIVEQELPAPGPGQIVVRNIYAGVNASDVNVSSAKYEAFVPGNRTDGKISLGCEAACEIVAVGEGVQGLKVGDQLLTLELGGGFCEYQVLDTGRPYPLIFPVAQATPELLAMVVNGLGASIGLKVVGEIKKGDTVLITAAAGGMGHIGVQIAKQAGAVVVAACGKDEKVAYLKELGCDRVLNYRKEDLGAVLKAEFPQGFSLIFELVGGEVFDICLENLALRGRLVIGGYISEYVSGAERIEMERIYTKIFWNSSSVRGYVYLAYPEFLAEHFQALAEGVLSGKLKVKIDEREFRGVESCVEAVEYLMGGRNTGKVIVRY